MPKTPDAGWKGAYSPETEYVPKGFDPTYEGDPEPEDGDEPGTGNALEEEDQEGDEAGEEEEPSEVKEGEVAKVKEKVIEKGEVSVAQTNKRYYAAQIRKLPLAWQAKINRCKRAYRECLIRAMKGPPHPRLVSENEKYRLLASLCRELQRLGMDKPFYLGVRDAGWLVNIGKSMAQQYLQDLRGEDIIKEVKKGFMKGSASEFFYLLDDL